MNNVHGVLNGAVTAAINPAYRQRRRRRRHAAHLRARAMAAALRLGRKILWQQRQAQAMRLIVAGVLLALLVLAVTAGWNRWGRAHDGNGGVIGPVLATVSCPADQPQIPTLAGMVLAYGMVQVADAAKKPQRKRGAIYARYSTRFQHSVEDQVRTCQVWAELHGIEIAEEHIFVDRAKTGKTHKREGYQAMLQALADDEIDVVVVFMTNRLYRKMYRALQFVEEEIIDRRKRCVFVRQGIDTDDKQLWQPLVQTFAMLDERQAAMLKEFLHAAHEGLLLKNWVHSTLTFGYHGKEVDGPVTRLGRPRTEWEIVPEHAEWVRKIFAWYLGTEPGIKPMGNTAIARRLNREGAPPPPKSPKKRWSPLAVRLVLRNRRYIGDWSYGVTEIVWQNKAGYGRQFEREKPLKDHCAEYLRIIEDAAFYAARERRLHAPGRGGRRKQGRGGESLPHLFENLLWCPKHERYLWSSGRKYYCSDCKSSPEPELYSLLRRDVAAKLICSKVAELLLADKALVPAIAEACRKHLQALQASPTNTRDSLVRKERELTDQIDFIYSAPTQSADDRAEKYGKLAALQRQRAEVSQQLKAVDGKKLRRANKAPNERELVARLSRLAHLLQRAASSDDARLVSAAHKILHLVSNGKITLTQQGERKAKRGWLRATFDIDILRVAGPADLADAGNEPHHVQIDLCESDIDIELARQAKRLFDEDLLEKDIARRLGLNRNTTHKLLVVAFAEVGQVLPDGRTRRSTLNCKHLVPPPYQKIAGEAKEWADKDLPLQEIAEKLGVDRNTATAALRYWHVSRGLPCEDGRSRRKRLNGIRQGAAEATGIHEAGEVGGV